MTPEQWIPVVISGAGVIYTVYKSGKTDVNETRAIVKEELKEADKLTALQFQHMAGDISKMNESISEILRMVRESIATKQDMVNFEFRISALEESNKDHYGSFREVRDIISSLRQRCASHRKSEDTSTFPKDILG